MKVFRELTPEEQTEFRAWARANYKPLAAIDGAKINAEYGSTTINAEKGE